MRKLPYFFVLLLAALPVEFSQARAEEPASVRIQVGKSIPDFEVTLLGDSSAPAQTISNKSLLGKTYLMDFWGTWCRPCTGEMPYLHEAWYNYSDAGFQILALAVSDTPETIRDYREEEQWPMPWLHHLVEDGSNGKLLETFGVSRYPTTILVGPSGEILALGGNSRGEKLLKLLASKMGRSGS
jgi:thiol-disulfide isomerase/thioredoxin